MVFVTDLLFNSCFYSGTTLFSIKKIVLQMLPQDNIWTGTSWNLDCMQSNSPGKFRTWLGYCLSNTPLFFKNLFIF